jgi:lipopolysaccharide transport system ATP-binding protein
LLGSAEEAVAKYSRSGADLGGEIDVSADKGREGSGEVRVRFVRICDTGGNTCTEFHIGDDLVLELELTARETLDSVKISVQIATADGINLANMVDVDSGFGLMSPRQIELLSICMNDIRFYPGTYHITVWLGTPDSKECYDILDNCISFSIVVGGSVTTRDLPRSAGLLFLTPQWKRHESGVTHLRSRRIRAHERSKDAN